MSHLSNIIKSINDIMNLYHHDIDRVVEDKQFRKSVYDLKNYIDTRSDYTEEEGKDAKRMYEDFIGKVKRFEREHQ